MNIPIDEYRLEMLAHDHSSDASVFVPFVIERLRASADATAAELRVTLRDAGQK